MQAMVTTTHNDATPEILAHIRRGPFAPPTEHEHFEYLLARRPALQRRPDFEAHATASVLSYQRRMSQIKLRFFRRAHTSPLGRIRDWWRRTEAQKRGALHDHILVWFF